MKIAVSGTHQTGKTTLVEELGDCLLAFEGVDEPYRQLEDEGHDFAEMPALEDFVLLLERSIATIQQATGDVVFDRCPCDMLAYLIHHEDSGHFDLDRCIPAVRDAMRTLDLVVYVPIENPDRIAVAQSDHGRLRQRVDDELRALILDDSWNFGVPALEVAGSVQDRVRQVLKHLGLGADAC